MRGSLENGAWFVWLQAYVPSNVHVASTLPMCPALKGKRECNLGIEEGNEAAHRMKVLAQICNLLKIYNFKKATKPKSFCETTHRSLASIQGGPELYKTILEIPI